MPERERLAEQPRSLAWRRALRLTAQATELDKVELPLVDPDEVTRAGRDDAVAERAPEPDDGVLHGGRPAAGLILAPERVEQLGRRHGPVRVQKQVREEGLDPRT